MSNTELGIGLRAQHLEQFVTERPSIAWVEVHSENYSTLGGLDFDLLIELRKHYPCSLHGIGMSLGSASGINAGHLRQTKELVGAIAPFLISEHLSWNTHDKFLPDLLPIPFNDEAMEIFSRNISVVQDALKRQILIENPSTYFSFTSSNYSEPEFLNLLAEKTGAGILLDVNNVYISGLNNGWSAEEYINNINPLLVKEMHLSGHSVKNLAGGQALYIDSHNCRISDDVWDLYRKALAKFGKVPTLIEWDENIPKLEVLLEEASKAQEYVNMQSGGVYA
ncbi:MAG: hypothetical protein COA94_08535 [Rickettsiales bacterium]|nr:MAG: hypothetical protein COA94_08535 [Rickettsiales bacterium]